METVIISTNHWRVPSVERAFSGILEGCPSPKERQQIIEETIAARAAWKPSAEGMMLVEQLKEFAGHRIQIQFWDSIMWWNEIEAPFPCNANCVGVVLLQDDGFPQAYLEVTDVTEVPNEHGYSPEAYFQNREGSDYLLAPVADIYSVTRIGTTA